MKKKSRKISMHDGPGPGPGSMGDDSFIWVSDFDSESLVNFYRDFSEKEQDDSISIIPIVISSYGGEVLSLMAMRDLIKSSPKPVATIALGKAMSAGACLLAAGTPGFRFASKDTMIMIHEVSGGAMGKTADVEESALAMKALNQKLLNNLAEDCGISVKAIEARMVAKKNVDWSMGPPIAKKLGMIDHIGIPRHAFNRPERLLMSVDSYDQQKKLHLLQHKKAAKKPPKKGS
jgi:ATP-dependent Clp endopeptidase proteolytic subunit ClpP